MSFTTLWKEQYTRSSPDGVSDPMAAVSAWFSVNPSAEDWTEWLNSCSQSWHTLHPETYKQLGHDEQLWFNFIQGMSKSTQYYDKYPISMLDQMRHVATPRGKSFLPLPFACLDALNRVHADTTPQWRQSFLLRPPSELFGASDTFDQIGLAALHQFSVLLLLDNPIPLGRLPSLLWSPSALYDDYGTGPSHLLKTQQSIQHALEYAVHARDVKNEGTDPLASAELAHYFKKSGLDLVVLNTLLDFLPEKATFGDVVTILHSMNSPQLNEYDHALVYEESAP